MSYQLRVLNYCGRVEEIGKRVLWKQHFIKC